MKMSELPVLDKQDQDDNEFAHYAYADEITEAYVTGVPVKAICGKVFVPTRDPEKFPICPVCDKLVNSGGSGG